MTAPSGIGHRNILPILSMFIEENPNVKVDLNLTNEMVDIVGLGYDLAIRVAPLKDSNLIATKLCDNPRVLCASPTYLARNGIPKKLDDLKSHRCIKMAMVSQWYFMKEGESVNHTVHSDFCCNSVESIRELSKMGQGIAQLTRLDIEEELTNQTLVEIHLEDVEPSDLAVWVLFPTKQYMPKRVRLFLEALKIHFKERAVSSDS